MATVNEKMTAIADNIRTKTGGTEALTLDAMAEGVNEVYDKGYDKGLVDLWDAMTFKGKRIRGERFFNRADFTEIEELPYPFTPTESCSRMFYDYDGRKFPRPQYVDLSKLPTNTDIGNLAAYCNGGGECTTFPDYGMPAMKNYNSTFVSSPGFETIEVIRSAEDSNFEGTFGSCYNLKNITFEGVIGKSISFSYSPLTVESMKNIILHLKNYADTANAGVYTLTLKDTCKTAMANLGAIPEFNNKTYDAYITDIGWNLA